MANEEELNQETEATAATAVEDAAGGGDAVSEGLDNVDLETIREVSNISVGAAGSNLAAIVGKDVDIPSPEVMEHASLDAMPEPFAGVDKTVAFVQFSEGLNTAAGYVFKTADLKTIADMMMGGGAEAAEGPLNEMQLSAVTEALSQMMNASATSMASVISSTIEVAQPEVKDYSVDSLKAGLPKLASERFVAVTFTLKIGADLSIEMIQLMTSTDAKNQVDKLLAGDDSASKGDKGMAARPNASNDEYMQSNPVTVQPVSFSSFDDQSSVYGEQNKNLALVMDVGLNLTVELGKTEISIREVLELTRGSVIELDRIAGEPVDLLANGKLIAKGEVVVIEDNFGLRITSIVSPAERLRGL